MDEKELEFILKEGEGQTREFKLRFESSLAEDLVAFSNANGGTILLGIRDDQKIEGIEITNRLKSQILDLARNCDPEIEVKLTAVKNILLIEVLEGKDKPYSCKGGFFLRVGSNSQKLKRDKIMALATSSGKIRFDVQQNEEFHFPRDFDEQTFRKFLLKNKLFTELATADALLNMGLAKVIKKTVVVNNAGALFFAKQPALFFPSAFLDCVLFKGRDKTTIIDRKTFREGLWSQLLDAREFLMKHLRLEYSFTGFERKENYEIPLRALEEALVNALMHRDYLFTGANISLFIFDDRIEIINPGGLPSGLEKKDFGKLSIRRNQLIADIFSRTPYVEQLGSGIQRMRQLMKERGLPFPQFEMDHFFVIIFKRKEPLKEPLKEPEKREEAIIQFLQFHDRVNRRELVIGLGMSLGTVKKDLQKLMQKGKIRKVGSKKTGYYELFLDKARN